MGQPAGFQLGAQQEKEFRCQATQPHQSLGGLWTEVVVKFKTDGKSYVLPVNRYYSAQFSGPTLPSSSCVTYPLHHLQIKTRIPECSDAAGKKTEHLFENL